MLLTSVLLGISVILVAHTRLYVEAPVNIFQTLKSQVLSEICSFLVKKMKRLVIALIIICPCSTRLLPIKYKLT